MATCKRIVVVAVRNYAMILFNLKRLSSKHRRIILIMAVVSGVVLIGGGYIFWSINTWNTYKTSYEGWQNELRIEADKAMNLSSATPSERTKKKNAFKDVSAKINSVRGSLCNVSAGAAWQRFVGELRQREESCARVVDRASVFGDKTKQVIAYLEHEQALAATISAAISASADKVTETTWSSQVSIWQNAGNVITKMSVSETSFKVVKTAALDKIKAIESAWQAVIAAHEAKDKAKYVEAQTALATAYAGLSELVNVGAQQFSAVADSLQSTYAELLSGKV